MMLRTTQKELCTGSNFMRCGLCGGATTSFKMIPCERDPDKGGDDCSGSDLRKKVTTVPLYHHNHMLGVLQYTVPLLMKFCCTFYCLASLQSVDISLLLHYSLPAVFYTGLI